MILSAKTVGMGLNETRPAPPAVVQDQGLDVVDSKMRVLKAEDVDIGRYAEMLSALGTQPRLRIMRLLLSQHPDGMIAGDIQAELGIPASTLSHHLEKLKVAGLAKVRREHCCLWYSANAEALLGLLSFFYSECCSKSRAVDAVKLFQWK